jgi:hydrogenase maturation protease
MTSEAQVWVMGLGTPFGDDRAGWEVVAQLRDSLPAGVQAGTTSDPLAVVDIPPNCERLIIIDAGRGAGAPGSVHRYEWPDRRLIDGGSVSTHGVGLVAALELTAVLGKLPARVVIFALEGGEGDSTAPGAGLSHAVETAIPIAVARILAEIGTENTMSEAVTPELLKTLSFLAPATDEELRLLVPVSRAESFSAGSAIFREGECVSQVFIVTEGTVALEISGPDHRPRRFQTISEGELLGWSPILGSAPMTASARALTDVRTVAINAKALLDVCENDPRFGFQFMRRVAAALAVRLNATRLQLLDIYKHDLPASPVGGWK